MPRNRTIKKAGRPPFKPTAAQRRKVSIAAGAGMSHEEIALGMGVSRPTLEKHFEHELSIGAYQRRIEALAAMHAAAKKGNISAQKAYLAMTPAIAAPPSEGAGDAGKPVEGKALKAKGKKEQAQDAAIGAEAGTEWEGILPPNVVQLR